MRAFPAIMWIVVSGLYPVGLQVEEECLFGHGAILQTIPPDYYLNGVILCMHAIYNVKTAQHHFFLVGLGGVRTPSPLIWFWMESFRSLMRMSVFPLSLRQAAARSPTAFLRTSSAELVRLSMAKSKACRGTELGPEASPQSSIMRVIMLSLVASCLLESLALFLVSERLQVYTPQSREETIMANACSAAVFILGLLSVIFLMTSLAISSRSFCRSPGLVSDWLSEFVLSVSCRMASERREIWKLVCRMLNLTILARQRIRLGQRFFFFMSERMELRLSRLFCQCCEKNLRTVYQEKNYCINVAYLMNLPWTYSTQSAQRGFYQPNYSRAYDFTRSLRRAGMTRSSQSYLGFSVGLRGRDWASLLETFELGRLLKFQCSAGYINSLLFWSCGGSGANSFSSPAQPYPSSPQSIYLISALMRSIVSFTLLASSKSSLSTALAISARCSLNLSPKLEICTIDPLYCSALSKSQFLMACSLSAASRAMNYAIYCSSSSCPPYQPPPPPTAAITGYFIKASGYSEPYRVSACSPTCEKKFYLDGCGLWNSRRRQRQLRSTIIVFCSRAAPLSFRVNCRQPYLQNLSSCPPVGTQQRISTCEAILR